MEKRKPTLARTLSCTAAAKLCLVAILLVPAILLAKHFRRPQPAYEWTQAHQKPYSKDLVKIYSIVQSHRPDLGDAETWTISETIWVESSAYGLDPLLVVALIDIESKFQSGAVSPAGARGIMQILPDVGKALAQQIGLQTNSRSPSFKPEHLDNPIFNIKLGVYYLQDLKKSFRSLNLALVAYNIGPTEIRNRLENKIGFSDEYATQVLAAYQNYKKAKPIVF